MRELILVTMLLGCAPTLPNLPVEPAAMNQLPPAMEWSRALGDPAWAWPYGFGGWELGKRPRRLDLIDAHPLHAPLELELRPRLPLYPGSPIRGLQ